MNMKTNNGKDDQIDLSVDSKTSGESEPGEAQDGKAPWVNKEQPKLSLQELIKKKFEESGIVPGFLPESPPTTILIIYQSGAKINLGNKITTYQCRQTDLFYWPVEFNKLYTVMILDIDFPTPANPIDRSYLMYLVCNVHANDISKGDTVAEYSVPQITKESGQHRVLVLGFKQASFSEIGLRIKKDNHQSRLRFSLEEFTQKHNLNKPIVGNFFLHTPN